MRLAARIRPSVRPSLSWTRQPTRSSSPKDTVSGDLLIEDNAALLSLDGLSSLETVSGSLIVRRNAALVSVDGLAGVTSITGDLKIQDNAHLDQGEARTVAYDVIGEGNVGGTITVSGNGRAL